MRYPFTLLVLIRTDNFPVKVYWWSLTDEHILAIFRDSKCEFSGNNETKSDNDNREDCVSLGRQESSI